MDNPKTMVPMPGIEKLQERYNETLLDHFENVCIALVRQENERGRVTAKVENDYTEAREKILAIMNGRSK